METLLLCNACGHQHVTQQDGKCPLCGAAVSAMPAVAPPVPSVWAHRLGGWFLVLVGALGLIASAMQQELFNTVISAPPETRVGAALAAIIDLTLGAFLLTGSSRAKGVAIFFCVLGVLATPPVMIAVGGYFGVVIGLVRLSFHVGMLLLLIGIPGSRRTWLGGLLVVAYLLLKLRLAWEAALDSGVWYEFWRVWLFG